MIGAQFGGLIFSVTINSLNLLDNLLNSFVAKTKILPCERIFFFESSEIVICSSQKILDEKLSSVGK